jgi:nitrogen regulatory protein P-II 1
MPRGSDRGEEDRRVHQAVQARGGQAGPDRRRREEWRTDSYRGVAYTLDLLPKIRLEVVVPDCRAERVISLITRAARNGPREAGTIWVSSVEDAIRIRTGERGEAAVW